MMKKAIRIALLMALVMAAVCIGVSAASYTSCADKLYEMGLFKGVSENPVNYDLDRAPTRAEAAVMLVRLLGKETEAAAQKNGTPFTDIKGVQNWAGDAIGWLYKNNLTAGTSATTYSPNTACSAQMYCTFALRALGYSETAGDFTYASALVFGEQIGVVNLTLHLGSEEDQITGRVFLRDQTVAISYQGLFTKVKGSDQLLCEKLVEQGAVSADKAQEYIDLAKLYAQISDANRKDTNGCEEAVSLQIEQTQKNDTNEMTFIHQRVYIKDKGGVYISKVRAANSNLEVVVMEKYLKDGYVYTRKTDGGQSFSYEKHVATEIDKRLFDEKLLVMLPHIIPFYAVTSIHGVQNYTIMYDPDVMEVLANRSPTIASQDWTSLLPRLCTIFIYKLSINEDHVSGREIHYYGRSSVLAAWYEHTLKINLLGTGSRVSISYPSLP